MQTIYQIDKNDLTEVISKIVLETIQNIPKPKAELLNDRIEIDEVMEITGLKKPQLYKLTHLMEIPFKKFGKRLVFSRREIIQWMENRTHRPVPSQNTINAIALSASAKQRR